MSRVLGAQGIGTYSYTFAIMQNFMLLANLGISNYATRQIAYYRYDLEKKSQYFWNMVYLTAISTTISLIMLVVCTNLFWAKYKVYLLVQGIYLMSSYFDISWYYMGIENFKKSVLKNSIVKLVGFSSIFILVKHKEDLLIYIGVLALSQFLGQLILWIDIKKEVVFYKINKRLLWLVFVGAMSMFIPQLAIKIYVVLNKVILGMMTNTIEVGYFDSSDKLVKILTAIVSTIGFVMLPRISTLFQKKEFEQIDRYLNKTLDFVLYLSLPIMMGIITCSPWFVPWFFGKNFIPVIRNLQLISPVILLVGMGTILGNQFLLPMNRVKDYTKAVVWGAFVNIIANVALIPYFKANGAAVATVISEICVTLILLSYARKNLEIGKIVGATFRYGFMSVVMGLAICLTGYLLKRVSPVTTLIQFSVGILSYGALSLMMRVPMIHFMKEKLKKKGG